MGKFDLNLILEMQQNNHSLDEILKEIEYKSISTLKGQMKKNGYILVNDKFILDKNINKADTVEINKNDLDLILNQLNDIKRYMVQDKYTLSVESEQINLKPFSIRVNESDLKDFNELCDQYQHISKSYMFSLALREFVKKYK